MIVAGSEPGPKQATTDLVPIALVCHTPQHSWPGKIVDK